MKSVLVKCPRSYKSHFPENSESLALGYLAAMLRKNEFSADVLDASLQGISAEHVIETILEGRYGLIGFTIADVTFVRSTIEGIDALRKGGTRAHITMGGHTPTFHCEDILNMCEGLDSIVMNEGEVTLVELAKCLKEGKDWRTLEGISCRTVSGIIHNPARKLIEDLDTIPFPARDTVPYILRHKKEEGVVSIAGGRGCPMNCGFCSIRAFYSACEGYVWRIRSNKNVVDEIESLVNTFDVQEVVMVDDIFVGPGDKNRERALGFADELASRDFRVMLSIAERVDNIDHDLFERLREVGIRNILVGIESGNQKLLDYFGKGISIKNIENAIGILKELDIGIVASFINFTPETTIEQLRSDIHFYKTLEINILQGLLNHFQYYKGTPLGEDLQKQGRVYGVFPDYSCPAKDERVNVVYDIAQRSLGVFLATAASLNRIGRKLRFKAFKAESESSKSLSVVKNEKFIYDEFVNIIIGDATELLLETIDFVSIERRLDEKKINNYCKQLTEMGLKKYQEWDKMLHAFELLSHIG